MTSRADLYKLMICRRCITPIRRVEHLSWWVCNCQVWQTDETISRGLS